MTNSDKTEIIAIIDRSGSMESIKKDMEGGFNSFLDQQKEEPGECLITLVQFDHSYDTVYSAKPITAAGKLVISPRGSTAYRDALGRAVTEAGERFAAMPEEQRPGTVIVTVVTDGQENSSREWTTAAVKELVQQQTEQYGWHFLFLGANIDALAEGSAMGIQTNSSLSYAPTERGAASAWSSTSAAVTRMRGGTYGGYTQEERDAAADASNLVTSGGTNATE